MPDLSSVLNTVAGNLVTPVYPNGTGQPSIVAPAQVTIEAAWPIRTQLDKDLQAGNAHVSVYPTNMERVMTKFERNFQPSIATAATLMATVSGNTITITGTVSVPQSMMAIVNYQGYAYTVQAGDTLNSIATNWANAIPNATAYENVITIGGVYSLIARIATQYSAAQELARMDRVFMISIWSPTPTIRATLESAIDIYMKQNYRIPLADNFFAQVFYDQMPWTDMLEKSLIYRSDLRYIIQYPTTVTDEFTTVADPYVNSIDVDWGGDLS